MKIKEIYKKINKSNGTIYYLIFFTCYKYPLIIIDYTKSKLRMYYGYHFNYCMKNYNYEKKNSYKKLEVFEIIFNNEFDELLNADEKFFMFYKKTAIKYLELFKEELIKLKNGEII